MKRFSLLLGLIVVHQTMVLSQPCLPEGIYFSTQSQIDSFQINFPNCSEIEGNVYISGENITNLLGLATLTSIGGYLYFYSCDSLLNFSGLENLTSVEYGLCIESCNSIQNLTGFSNLSFLGGNLGIWNNDNLETLSGIENLVETFHLDIESNNSLISLIGLENLTTVNSMITIFDNFSLESLSGIDNINPEYIGEIVIHKNSSLCTCEVESICNYLADPSSNANINTNDIGCNSREEVEQACGPIGIDETLHKTQSSIYPNPAKGSITISSSQGEEVTSLNIYNSNGQLIKTVTCKSNSIDVSSLTPGIYIIEYAINGNCKHERVAIY